jgi:hypothetical protein
MTYSEEGIPPEKDGIKEQYARDFAAQAQRLAGLQPSQEDETTGNTQATEVTFVTPHDPVVQTERGPLPVVPIEEALKLNHLKDRLEEPPAQQHPRREGWNETWSAGEHREHAEGRGARRPARRIAPTIEHEPAVSSTAHVRSAVSDADSALLVLPFLECHRISLFPVDYSRRCGLHQYSQSMAPS